MAGVHLEDEYVTIHVFKLEQLLDKARFLDALERAGVIEWEGYERAGEIYEANSEVGITT